MRPLWCDLDTFIHASTPLDEVNTNQAIGDTNRAVYQLGGFVDDLQSKVRSLEAGNRKRERQILELAGVVRATQQTLGFAVTALLIVVAIIVFTVQ